MEYTSLEPSNLTALGMTAPSFKAGESISFFATSSFIYGLFFTAIVIAAFFQLVGAGMLQVQASEASIRQSKEKIKKVTLGLLGVFSLFLILFTVNKGLVNGEIGLGALATKRFGGGVAAIPSGTSVGSGGSSKACESSAGIIQKLQSGNVCAGTVCKTLTGCNWKQYESIIDQATGGDSMLKKMTIVTMCKESGAVPNRSHQNDNGTFDCGLMQINQNGSCTDASYSVVDNITEGVRRMKQKISASSQTYLSVPAVASVFASYNCCGNGTPPNAPSVDCTTQTGFQNAVPKWVCPINPGDGTFNMCSVKNYACELTTCLDSL